MNEERAVHYLKLMRDRLLLAGHWENWDSANHIDAFIDRDGVYQEAHANFWNRVHERLDAWLKAGRPEAQP